MRRPRQYRTRLRQRNALKITAPNEPITVDRLNVVIYGPPGLHKSSLAYTGSKALLLDFDHGSHRARRLGDTSIIEKWSDAANLSREDVAKYETIVVDTAGRALDMLTAELIDNDPKLGAGGALTLKGYGVLKSRFIDWMKRINSFGLDVVLICHMTEQQNGDTVSERLDIQGGSKGEIYKVADLMGRVMKSGGRVILTFDPSDAAYGKNPAGFDPIPLPHYEDEKWPGFMGRLIAEAKKRINAMNSESAEAAQAQEAFRQDVAAAMDAGAVNALMERAAALGAFGKTALHKRATALKLTFDKESKSYTAA